MKKTVDIIQYSESMPDWVFVASIRMSVFLLCLFTLSVDLSAQQVESGTIRSLINQTLGTMPDRDSNSFVQPNAGAIAAFTQVFDLAATRNYSQIQTLISPYGYDFIQYHHQGNITDTLFLIRERAPIQRGWGTYIWRATAYERNVQVQVPHPLFDFNTPAIGLRAFLDHRMRFFLMAGTHRYANGDNSTVSDMARNANSIFQLAHQRWSQAPALQVHGFNDGNSIYDGYPQNIITNGTTSPPPVHYTVRDLLRARAYTAEVYDVSTRDAVRLLAATQNSQGQWSASNNHVFLHIEMPRDLRTIATQIGRVGESFRDAFAPMSGPMSGIYTVGEGGEYANLGAAFTGLTSRGIDGDVTLLIGSDVTESHNIFYGLDAGDHHITIRPAPDTQPTVLFTAPENNSSINGVMIFGATGDNANAFTTTRNITIDGSAVPGGDSRDLTFEITPQAGSLGYFRIVGDVQNMTIRNAVFRSLNTAFDTWFISPIVSSGEELFPQQITFENNLIQGNPERSSGRAIIVWGQGSASVGPRNLLIRNNTIMARRYGVWLRVAGGSTTIDGNTIEITETILTDAHAIRFDDIPDSTDEIVIRNNSISGASPGNFTAVHIQAPATYTLQANQITGITSGELATGVHIDASGSFTLSSNLFRDFSGATGVEMLSVLSGIEGDVDLFMVNNRFTGFHSDGTQGGNLLGLIIRSALEPHRVTLTMYHNTIRLNPIRVAGSGWEYRGLSMFSNVRIGAVLRNNLFLNDDDNDSRVTSYAYFQGGSAAAAFDSDSNLFGGSNLSGSNSTWLARHGAESSNTTDIAGLRQASGGDALSVQRDDIVLDEQLRLDEALRTETAFLGIPLAAVRVDAFGNNRDAEKPTRGAIEFAPTTASYDEGSAEIPFALHLDQNYPNPFNPTTVIGYSIAETGLVSLEVYDLLGQRVAVLVSETQLPGRYQVRFDASRLAAGVYVYVLQSKDSRQARRMLLIK